jgi:hypothetical protein
LLTPKPDFYFQPEPANWARLTAIQLELARSLGVSLVGSQVKNRLTIQ